MLLAARLRPDSRLLALLLALPRGAWLRKRGKPGRSPPRSSAPTTMDAGDLLALGAAARVRAGGAGEPGCGSSGEPPRL